jgi:sugar phosphate isomerase/epimerase
MTSVNAFRDVKGSKSPEVSLSTMWAKGRFACMDAFAARAVEFGFTHVEVNASVSPQMLRELIASKVNISSFHCPCPAVVSSRGKPAADLSLSSLDESERREALGFARQTIDLASSVNARAVVLHMGEVPMHPTMEAGLHRLYSEGRSATREYRDTREDLVYQRKSRAAPYLGAAKESLRELSEYGRERGVILGVETRFHVNEIPSLDEAGELLGEARAGTAGYWHDVGHAVVQQCLGFGSHEEWLSRFGHSMIGIHLHDVLGISDHHAPGEGDVDWDLVARHLPAEAIKVCEIGEWNSEERVSGVVAFLQKKEILT